ncbi:MAG: dihydrolipoyllysine-residue succinyltransferase [Chthoniobacteraceae bacterium]|nr:dihydrolipoyllysine-residue succinyltransferase [Chthoniobacteraceae bacterium]
MSLEIKIPSVGESIVSGVLSVWHKQEGETVAPGDILFTLETDKVSTEITAEKAGVLHQPAAQGEEVKIGQVAAPLEEPGAGAPPPAPKEAQPQPAPAPVAPPAPKEERFTRKKMSPLRRKIAAQLVMAQQTAAILTTFNECDMSAVMDLRARLKDDFAKEHGVKLGFMSFFLKAAVAALKAVPGVNSRLDGEDLILNHYFDIGVAVGTERGLVVPVIRDADRKSFAQLEKDILVYAGAAREGKLRVEDLQGGVFTISNGGVYGSLMSTPILNPPQSGILGLHKIMERPIAVQGQVAIRPMMNLALSYDHRVVDGKEAVTFLIKVKEAIEDPARLLLDM